MTSNDTDVEIASVTTGSQRRTLHDLLEAYHEWIADTAPVPYDPVAGVEQDERAQSEADESWAWIALVDDEPVGCVLCYGEGGVAEFRRLWVDPDARGNGVGRRLVETVIEYATDAGYDTLALATPPWSEAAHALYESLGFERTGPYPEARLDEQYHDDAIFMQRPLSNEQDR